MAVVLHMLEVLLALLAEWGLLELLPEVRGCVVRHSGHPNLGVGCNIGALVDIVELICLGLAHLLTTLVG